MRTQTFGLAAALTFAMCPAGMANSEEASKPIPYTFTVTQHTLFDGEEEGQAERVERTLKFRVDPRAPAGQRTTILSKYDGELEESDKKRVADYEKAVLERGAFWCNRSKWLRESDYEVLSETDDEKRVKVNMTKDLANRIVAEAGDDAPASAKKLMRRMDMEMVLAKPDGVTVKRMQRLLKPTRVNGIAKVSKMETQLQCETAPDGGYYRGIASIESKASAFFGAVKVDVNSRTLISDLEPIEFTSANPSAGD